MFLFQLGDMRMTELLSLGADGVNVLLFYCTVYEDLPLNLSILPTVCMMSFFFNDWLFIIV